MSATADHDQRSLILILVSVLYPPNCILLYWRMVPAAAAAG